MGRYITVTVSPEGLYSPLPVSWGDIGMIGNSTGTASLNTAYVIKNPDDAKDLFGQYSALYNSILLAFNNGANKVIAVPTEATAETQETFNGDGSETEFTLTAGIPVMPIDGVTVDSVPQVEGEDFYVDYGNQKVIFYTAPASGTDNVAIDFSTHSLTQVNAALDVLAEKNVQIVVGSMIFDSALLSAIKTHVIGSTELPRIGIYMLKQGETTTTLADTLADKLSVLIAHKSYKDAAAILAGRIAGLEPWKDLTMKSLSGLEQGDRAFTSTEIAAFDAKHIITAIDPPKLAGSGEVVSTGWTLDDTGVFNFIDQIRVALHLSEIVEVGLTNPDVIGTLRMNRTGLREVDLKISSLLSPWVNVGEIDNFEIINPARALFELVKPDEEDTLAKAALQASRRLEGAYIITIKLYYSGTIIYIAIKVVLTGGA